MNLEIFLINFRVPSGLKIRFEETCHQIDNYITAKMNRMIKGFVERSEEDLCKPLGCFFGHGGKDDI